MSHFTAVVFTNHKGFEENLFLNSVDEKTAFEDVNDYLIDRMYDNLEANLHDDLKTEPYEINVHIEELPFKISPKDEGKYLSFVKKIGKTTILSNS